jgi:hypothetical protein
MLPLYPRVPHFIGSNAAPDDLVMSARAQARLLAARVCVFEKLDGVNAALGLHRGQLRCELRPPWDRALDGAMARALHIYVRQREARLAALLAGDQIAYGEWLWQRVSISYSRLPALLVLFGLRAADGRLRTPAQLRRACARVGLACVQPLFEGRIGSLERLRRLAGRSHYGAARAEGLVVERTHRGAGWACAKWVGPGYRHVTPGALSGARNQLAPEGRRR